MRGWRGGRRRRILIFSCRSYYVKYETIIITWKRRQGSSMRGGVGWWLKVEIKKRYGNVLIITTGLAFNPFLPRFPVINRRQWKGDWKPSVVHIAVYVAINIFFFRVWNAINVIKVPLPRHYESPAVWSETPKFLLLKTVSTVFLYIII